MTSRIQTGGVDICGSTPGSVRDLCFLQTLFTMSGVHPTFYSTIQEFFLRDKAAGG